MRLIAKKQNRLKEDCPECFDMLAYDCAYYAQKVLGPRAFLWVEMEVKV